MYAFLHNADSCSDSLQKAVNFYAKDLQDFQTVQEEWVQWKALINTLTTGDEHMPLRILKIMLQHDFCTAFLTFTFWRGILNSRQRASDLNPWPWS